MKRTDLRVEIVDHGERCRLLHPSGPLLTESPNFVWAIHEQLESGIDPATEAGEVAERLLERIGDPVEIRVISRRTETKIYHLNQSPGYEASVVDSRTADSTQLSDPELEIQRKRRVGLVAEIWAPEDVSEESLRERLATLLAEAVDHEDLVGVHGLEVDKPDAPGPEGYLQHPMVVAAVARAKLVWEDAQSNDDATVDFLTALVEMIVEECGMPMPLDSFETRVELRCLIAGEFGHTGRSQADG